MASICRECRHYKEIDGNVISGFCVIQLPPWVVVRQKYGAGDRSVDALDTCDLWNIDKGNA